jgi:uncharacterized protein with PQ loop repeat
VIDVAAPVVGLLIAIVPLDQLRRLRRVGRSEAISIPLFGVYGIGQALWAAYGVAHHDLPFVIVNGVGGLVNGCVVVYAAVLRSRPP